MPANAIWEVGMIEVLGFVWLVAMVVVSRWGADPPSVPTVYWFYSTESWEEDTGPLGSWEDETTQLYTDRIGRVA